VRRIATAVAVVSLAVLAGCSDDDGDGDTGPVAETRECGVVAFSPNSEDAAGQIMATGLSCEDAKAFVEDAGARTSSGGPQSVVVNGFRCVLTSSQDDPLPRADYECTDGPKKVTFVRT
jgi:hypothetical protein